MTEKDINNIISVVIILKKSIKKQLPAVRCRPVVFIIGANLYRARQCEGIVVAVVRVYLFIIVLGFSISGTTI